MMIVYDILISPIQTQFLKLVLPYRKKHFKMTNEEIYSYKKKTKVLLKKGTKQLLICL